MASELVGRTIGGYEVLALVGEGGMGSVYRARQISLDREVALKVLAERLSRNPEFVDRFKREARSIARLNHPNILQVYDVAEAEGLYWISMEFIRGTSLTEKLRARGFLEWRECAEVIRQSALGLASAARAHIIHRDIKPDNLMITEEAIVKVSDFGLAKEVAEAGELTSTGDLLGTPAYMSPEQCDGAALDTRTDIYSLGATFYRAATGVLPFNAPTPVAMMYKHKHESLIPPRQYMPSLPESIDLLIRRMMEKDPDDRYASCDEVAISIDEALVAAPMDVDATLKFTPPSAPLRRSSTVLRPSLPPAPATPATPPTPAAAGAGLASGGLNADELVQLGDRFFQERRPVAACDFWERALQLRPDDEEIRRRLRSAKQESTEACHKLGDGILAQGRFATLRADLQRQLQVDPENPDVREKIAALDYLEKRKRETLLEIRKKLGSGDAEGAHGLWEDLHEGLRDKALEPVMTNLAQRVLPAQRLAREAEALGAGGRFEEAFERWEKASSLDPSNERIRIGRYETQSLFDRMEGAVREGYELFVQRRHAEAAAKFEEALRVSPEHGQGRKYLRECTIELASKREEAGEFDMAVALWRGALDRDPNDRDLMQRLEDSTRRKNALAAAIDAARAEFRRGKYLKSASSWSRALAMQPSCKPAQFGRAEAVSAWRRRRLLPVILLFLVALGGGAGWSVWRFLSDRDAGDAAERTGAHAEAIAYWRRALTLPAAGRLAGEELRHRIAQAELRGELEACRAAGAESFRAMAAPLLVRLQAETCSLPQNEAALWTVRLEGGEGAFLAAEGKDEAALAAFRRAEQAGGEGAVARDDAERGRVYGAFEHWAQARDRLARKGPDADSEALRLLREAVRLRPGFAAAETLLAELESRVARGEARGRDAAKALQKARGLDPVVDWAGVSASLAEAKKAADEALAATPGDWEKKKIALEAAWRLEAGADMVFVLHPADEDPEMRRRFRAFALDRFEWPGRKGEKPKPLSFREALETARKAGKSLPTREEWSFAAQGGAARRIFPYGNVYNASLANTNGQEPGPAGSYAATDGLFDLSGNLAEWVSDPSRKESVAEQFAAGGHFSSRERSRAVDAALFRVDVTHREVGLRGAKRWEARKAE